MRFLLRLLVFFIVVSTVLSIVRNAFQPTKPPTPMPDREPEGNQPVPSSHLVKDPVCGTYVPESTAIRGKNAYFCSEECRRKYEL